MADRLERINRNLAEYGSDALLLRADLDWLLDEIERLRAALDDAKAAHIERQREKAAAVIAAAEAWRDDKLDYYGRDYGGMMPTERALLAAVAEWTKRAKGGDAYG